MTNSVIISPDRVAFAPVGVDAATGNDGDMLFSSNLAGVFGVLEQGSGESGGPSSVISVPFSQTYSAPPLLLTRRKWTQVIGNPGFNNTESWDLPPTNIWLSEITRRTRPLYYFISSNQFGTSWASYIFIQSYTNRVEIRHEVENGGKTARYPVCQFEWYVLDINI